MTSFMDSMPCHQCAAFYWECQGAIFQYFLTFHTGINSWRHIYCYDNDIIILCPLLYEVKASPIIPLPYSVNINM